MIHDCAYVDRSDSFLFRPDRRVCIEHDDWKLTLCRLELEDLKSGRGRPSPAAEPVVSSDPFWGEFPPQRPL